MPALSIRSLLLAVAFAGSVALTGHSAAQGPSLTLDDLFPRRPFTGKTASGMKWSHDGRYLTYQWNTYDDRASDIWLYDSKSGKSERLTSIELMATFDRETAKAIDRYKEDKKREDEWDKLSDEEYRKARQKKKEEDEKRKEPLPSYPGCGQVDWANASHEFLFVSRGDIYRWKVGDKEPTRLTRTRESEA